MTPTDQEARRAWGELPGTVMVKPNIFGWIAGYVAAAKSRDQRIKELEEAIERIQWGWPAILACQFAKDSRWMRETKAILDALQPSDLLEEGAEADPDVADTAWAIIDHHRKHRTAG